MRVSRSIVDALLRELAREVARELPAACAVTGQSVVGETRHLQPVTADVAARLARAANPAASTASHLFGDKLGWIGLGHVDVVFQWPNEQPTFLELKSCDLHHCAWDSLKLASGVLAGNASAGYMLAVAPSRTWEQRPPGSELFGSGEWQAAELRRRFAKTFKRYAAETYPHIPGRVAAAARSIPLDSSSLKIQEAEWLLRLVRVEPVVKAGWANWESLS